MDPMVESQLKEWVVLVAMLTFVVWGLYLATMAIRRKQQNAMQKALLDKFSSAHDFAEFMQSPAGQKYVMSFTDMMTSPRDAILKSVQIGIIALFAGGGLVSAGQRNQLWAVDTLGVLLWTVGAGFLLSALVSYFLAKKLDSKLKE